MLKSRINLWYLPGILLLLTLAAFLPSQSYADELVTTRFDVNGSVYTPSGTDLSMPGAKSINFGSGGISYTNNFDNGGAGNAGATVTAVGFIPLTGTANQGTSTNTYSSLSGPQGIIVYAIRGTQVSALPDLKARFTEGQIRIIDRSSTAGSIDTADPSTWFPGDATNDIFEIKNNPITAVSQGEPNGNLTESPIVVNPGDLNTAQAELDVSAGSEADFVFKRLVDAGLSNLLSNWEFGDDEDLLLNLEQQLVGSHGLSDAELTDLVDGLNDIFDAFFGTTDGFAPGGANAAGDGFDPNDPFVPGDTDTVSQNTGGLLTPVYQVQVEVVPEPSSMLVWLVALAVVGLVVQRSRSRFDSAA